MPAELAADVLPLSAPAPSVHPADRATVQSPGALEAGGAVPAEEAVRNPFPPVGGAFQGFEVLSELGRGAMGWVSSSGSRRRSSGWWY